MQINFPTKAPGRPLEVRIPFLRHQTGLGDAVANATKAAGVKPCGGCQQRQEALNRRVQLVPWNT